MSHRPQFGKEHSDNPPRGEQKKRYSHSYAECSIKGAMRHVVYNARDLVRLGNNTAMTEDTVCIHCPFSTL